MGPRSGSEPEFSFGDALGGSGGMSDPIDSTFLSTPLVGEMFPDALSASALPALTPSTSDGSDWLASTAGEQVPAVMIAQPVPARAVARRVPQSRQYAPRRTAPAAAVAAPRRPGAVVAAPLGRAVVGMAPPGGPPVAAWPAPGRSTAVGPTVNYAPGYAPVVAPTAAPAGYRPVAAPGYVPVPTAAAYRSGATYSPSAAYPSGVPYPPPDVSQMSGMSDVRAAIAQARQMAAASRGASAPPRATVQRKSTSSASTVWSLLVFAVIILFATGLGQKVISLISEFLQRK